jgi:uncharacterized protein YbjT (DUF2867 family)
MAENKVLIAGASSGVGVALARLLKAKGVQPVAFIRGSSNAAGLEAAGATIVRGDVLEAADVKRAIEGAGTLAAVVSIVGGRPFRGKEMPPDLIGNRNLIDAAKSAGVPRFVMVSSLGAGGSRAAAPFIARLILGRFMTLKTQAEELLRASGLQWTIIRPGHLRDGEPTGRAALLDQENVSGAVVRADVAALVARSLDDPATIGRTYSCIEPKS